MPDLVVTVPMGFWPDWIAEGDAVADRAERYLRRAGIPAERAQALCLHFGALGDARQAARQELQRLHRELSDARDQARARAAEPTPDPAETRSPVRLRCRQTSCWSSSRPSPDPPHLE